MNPIVLLRKLFLGGTWYVGLRDVSLTDGRNYKQVETPKGQWIADPFLYEEKGHHYLFVEQYFKDKQRAGIGVYDIVDGKAINNRVIIDNPYHMSYPCVFNYNGKRYMIPESSANNTVDIYMAEEFPDKWKHVKSLIKGEKYVDSTVYIFEDVYYLLSYKKVDNGWDLVVFLIDMENLELTKKAVEHFSTNIGRPGGFLFQENGKLLRPAQDCSKKYGESLIIYNVQGIKNADIQETAQGVISHRDVVFPVSIDRVHTLNTDSRYEVVDVFKEKIDLLHGIRIFKRAYLKH